MAFQPKYQHPVTLAQLHQLSPSTLTEEIARLQNSIAHLKRSNAELAAFLNPSTSSLSASVASVPTLPSSTDREEKEEELDEETKAEFQSSIDENEVTIAAQTERLEMIRIALEDQLGVEATNSHYDLVEEDSETVTKLDEVEEASGEVQSVGGGAQAAAMGGAGRRADRDDTASEEEQGGDGMYL